MAATAPPKTRKSKTKKRILGFFFCPFGELGVEGEPGAPGGLPIGPPGNPPPGTGGVDRPGAGEPPPGGGIGAPSGGAPFGASRDGFGPSGAVSYTHLTLPTKA